MIDGWINPLFDVLLDDDPKSRCSCLYKATRAEAYFSAYGFTSLSLSLSLSLQAPDSVSE